MNHSLTILMIAACLALIPMSIVADDTNALSALQQSFQKQEQALLARYDTSLGSIMAEAKKNGDLDAYVAVEAERKRFEEEKTIPSLTDANTTFLTAAGSYYKARAGVLKQYVASLDGLVKSEVQAGRIDSAKEAKIERDKIDFLLADVQTKLPAKTVVAEKVMKVVPSGPSSWDISTEYSFKSNPNGVWSYGRKPQAKGAAFDLMTARWGDSGWYLGGSAWAPSIQGGPLLWANDNANGYPAVRWKCPRAGRFNIKGCFKSADTRGVDALVYVIANGVTIFSGRVSEKTPTAEFSKSSISLVADASIDFVMEWGGTVNSDFNWTDVDAIISAVRN